MSRVLFPPLWRAALTAAGAVLATYSLALARSPADGSIELFEARIRPVLVDRCFECHGPGAKKPKGGLRLDSRALALRGGDSGAVIVPGRPQESLLIEALRHSSDSRRMPPDGKLSKNVIAAFEEWVRQGASWPDGGSSASVTTPAPGDTITAEQRAFWSFQPVKSVSPPAVAEASWPENDVDRFVLRRLEERRWKPAGRADRRRLIRRATFDLTGLPPTPREIEAFLPDGSPGAFARVVDRLLDSPRHGEHWARHWLDGVRYVSDVGYYNFSDLGWRYRDWVIRALNDDLPYDRFVISQIAGDLLPPSASAGAKENERAYADGVVATGVLAMGNYDDQESNKEKLYAEVIDDQIDLISRQFLGLTISCARCHDHKFDPITMADYYALGGIFLSSRVLQTGNRIGAPRLKISLTSAAGARRSAELRERIKQAQDELRRSEEESVSKTTLAALGRRLEQLRRDAPLERGDAIGVQEGGYGDSRHDRIGDMPIYVRGDPFRPGPVTPRRFPRVLAGDDQQPLGERTSQSGRLELARWIASPGNPLTARVMVNRLWQYHFGQGLVRTPSDFGSRGRRPTHPLLLDYLADQLGRSRWSLKAVQRLIMNSATYQQSSEGDDHTLTADPENIFLGRFSFRRLAAEEIYDSLLAVSGRLGAELGQGKGNRAVYTRIGHEHPFRVASLFDAPATGTTAPQRTESTTAPQALYMLNDDFVITASRSLTERLARAGDSDEAQVDLAYRVAYGRPASPREVRAGRAYLESLPRDRRWTYFQVLLCANEFIYLD